MALSQAEQQAIFEESLRKKKMEQSGETNPISSESPNVQKQAENTQNKALAQVLTGNPKATMRMLASDPANQQNINTLVDQVDTKQVVKDQTKQIISNPQALLQKHNEIETKIQEGKPLGLLDTFVQTASFFIPQALGMVVGGALEGTEGAVAGGELGGALGQQYRQYQQDQQKLGLAQHAEARQTREGIVDRSIKIQALDPNSLENKLATEKLAVSKGRLQLDQINTARLAKEQRLREQRSERDYKLREAKFGLDKVKESQLSDSQVKDLNGVKEVTRQLSSFNFNGLNSSGPVEGRIKSFAESLGISKDVDFIELKAQTGSVLAKYMQSISGSAISEREATRLIGNLPTVKDNSVAFISKLNRFQRELDISLKSKVDSITKGQELRAESAKKFLEKDKPIKSTAITRENPRSELERLRKLKASKGK